MYDPAVNLSPVDADPAYMRRIRKAKARVIGTRPGMDLENAVLLTESFRRTEGEPLVIRKSKAFREQCTKKPAPSAGIHCILHAAGTLDTINCVSYEKFVLDDDLIGMVKHIRRGVAVDDVTLALDAIKETGPRGHFLTKTHTLQNCRRSLFRPRIPPQRPDVRFRETEAASHIQKATERWKAILEDYRQPALPESIDRDIRDWMERL